MKTTLICTVGGSHQPIVKAIETLQPDKVCFVCSMDDPATGNKGSYIQITGKGNVIKARFGDEKPSLPNIPTQTGLSPEQIEVLEVGADDFDDVYRKVGHWLTGQDREAGHIVADYTGGTKTMSAALALAALDDERVELQFVSGARADLVKVASGSEQVVAASVEAIRFRRGLEKALLPWQRYAYDETVALLQAMSPPCDSSLRGEYQRALDVSMALAAWDRFDHASAEKIIARYRGIFGKSEELRGLLTSLDLLTKDCPGQEPMKIYDLWRNAQRRAAQGRYDDAVARAYRLLEWTAQWLLGGVGIKTSDVPVDKIPEGITLSKNSKGEYQAGLFNAWSLAAVYSGDVVASFWVEEQEKMRDHIQVRNYSILAHGFEPLGEDAWQRFAGWIEQSLIPLLLEMTAQQPWRIRQLPGQLPTRLG